MIKAEEIQSIYDAQNFVSGVINDFECGVSTKEETLENLGEYTSRLMELFWENALKKIRENPNLLK